MIAHGEKLQEQLALAMSWDELVAIRLRVLELSIHGSLPQAEAQSLFPEIHQKGLSLWPIPEAAARDLPSVAIMKCMQAQQPVRVIIDGHNLLFRLGFLYGPGGRDRLIEHVREMVETWTTLSVMLWFDGDVSETLVTHPRLETHFAGGKGRDKADKAILNHLRERRVQGLEASFVVSDDKGVWRRALGMGGVRVCCAEFRCLLSMTRPGTEPEHSGI